MALFDDDVVLLAVGAQALPIISLGFLVSAVGVIGSGVMEALGRGMASLLISLLRQFLLTVPLAWILAERSGINGVWMALPLAEVLAFLCASLLLWRLYQETS